MRKFLIFTIICVPLAAFGQATGSANAGPEDLSVTDGPPMLGVHWARGSAPSARVSEANRIDQASPARSSSPLMTYHGGKILPSVYTQAIFWGTSWKNYTGDKISGMDIWYSGFGGSDYATTSDEYTGSNGQVGPYTTYLGHITDTSASVSGGNTSKILGEVCRVVTPESNGTGYYAVYADTPRGNANYCAYHSYGTCGGVPVQFAYFFKLDGDSGCDPQDTSGQHSQGLAAIANVSGHELSEARTDPASPGAWYDRSGEENGDKCAWTFGAPLVTFSDGTQWKIQGEWSNAAYNSGTGYPNSSGQKGCLSGK